MVPRESGKRPLALFFRPAGEQWLPATSNRSVLTFVLDPEGPTSAREADLQRLYGFTSAEARLAKLLITGSTFADCCAYLNIRPSTARMHLGNLYAKTGVQRQGQLIAVLLKSVGVMRMASADEDSPSRDQNYVSGREDRPRSCTTDILRGGLEALDSLHAGVVVLNSLREVLFANEAARQILTAGEGLEITAQNVLSSSRKNLIPFLGVPGRTQAHPGSVWRLTSTDSVVALPRSRGKRPLTLVFRSLNRGEEGANPRSPAVLLFMLDPELPIPSVEPVLRELYSFTSCEARLAHLLMEGHALEDCCEQLGIRPSTARMHLASMFSKVGVQRQGALIYLLFKSVCMIRSSQVENVMPRSETRTTETSNRFRVPGSESRESKSVPPAF
jgi:DNA-binding CsgD family transcriptional regulator